MQTDIRDSPSLLLERVLPKLRVLSLIWIASALLPGCEQSAQLRPTLTPASQAATAKPTDPVIAAAGDIACSQTESRSNSSEFKCQMQATADLLKAQPFAAVLPLGDLQYPSGTLLDFQTAYQPTWGSIKDISRPIAGNHEYGNAGASGYFQYFGPAAGDPQKGYYSYDLGSWHLIALNSNCQEVGGCGVGSPQEQWLKADLAAHPAKCTLAYWHHPRFSSAMHGNNRSYDAFWQDLYAAGSEIVLSAHDHSYERFAPQTPTAKTDAKRGIREFVVGTGGKNLYPFVATQANSEVRNNDTYGVLQLTLHTNSYSWQFLPIQGQTFTDSGSGMCH